MEQRHRHGYLYGTMVLAAGTVVVKLIGALFKIPLTNILGGVGMSYFNVAYELYYPLYALFVSGVPVAVSKLVSESMACGRARDARKLLRVAGGGLPRGRRGGKPAHVFRRGVVFRPGAEPGLGVGGADALPGAFLRLPDGGAARLLAGDAGHGPHRPSRRSSRRSRSSRLGWRSPTA